MIRQFLIFGLILLTNQLLGQSAIFIQDAVEKKMIEYKIRGSWNRYDNQQFLDAEGQYLGKCMTIDIKSKTDNTIWIYIDNGLMLMCEDSATQDMIITKPLYVELEPRKSKTVQLYAMCSEIHDGMPHTQTLYSVGKMADNNLVSITKAIDEMFMHNVVGQGAVWAYTDDATEDDLRKYGATNASIKLTVQVLNKANVKTKINPTETTDTDSKPVNAVMPVHTAIPDSSFISLDKYLVYSAGGVILLLFGSTVYFLIRSRKRRRDKNTST